MVFALWLPATASLPVLVQLAGVGTLDATKESLIMQPGDWRIITKPASGSSTDAYHTVFCGGPPERLVSLPAASGNVVLDFAKGTIQTLAASGNLLLTTSNVGLLRRLQVVITNVDTNPISLAYPASWAVYGTALPNLLAPGKKLLLSLQSLGNTDEGINAGAVLQV